MNAIVTTDLSKRYRQVTVVDRLTLSVPAGIVFGYLGPNGAGKTTTIRMLCGVLSPSAGEATVGGVNIREADAVKSVIGYANQAGSVYLDLTLEENLQFKASLYLPPRAVKGAVERIIERLQLEPLRKKLAGTLSGGYRQRLLIGTAIVHNPQVVFLDEPTAAVDPVGRRELWDVIYGLSSEGMTVFVSTHYMEEAERCHRIAMISSGRVLAEGSPDNVRRATPGAFYRFEPQDLLRGLQDAKATPGVRDAWISGNNVRLAADTPLENRILETLGTVEPVTATLEDAFVNLALQDARRQA